MSELAGHPSSVVGFIERHPCTVSGGFRCRGNEASVIVPDLLGGRPVRAVTFVLMFWTGILTSSCLSQVTECETAVQEFTRR